MMTKEGFKYSILASGSSGNCFYLETAQKKILVDAGLSGKKITSLLCEIDRKPEDLDAIFVTHEHKDHIHGVGVLARKYHLDIYANEETWQAMDAALGQIDVSQKHIFEMGTVKTFGDLDIESFGVSHDAAAPQFYRFMKDNKSFVLLTDTGYVSDRMAGIVENADGYLIENITSKPSYVVFLQPIYVKNKFITIKNYIDNYNNTDIKFKVLNRHKTILAETIPNSELELINNYKLVFIGITVPAKSNGIIASKTINNRN